MNMDGLVMMVAGVVIGVAVCVGGAIYALVLLRRLGRQIDDLDDRQMARQRTLQLQLTAIQDRLGGTPAPAAGAGKPSSVTPPPPAAVPVTPVMPVEEDEELEEVELPPVLAHVRSAPALAPLRTPQAGPAAASSSPTVPPASPPPVPPVSEVESRAAVILGRIWSWIVVGEESRARGVTWEFAFATNWLIRLCVLTCLFLLGYFVKYSIDHGFFSPELRVAFTLAGGAGLIVVGMRLAGRRYDLLGMGLAGIGLAAFYFGVFASCAYYHFIGALPAFALMAVVTAGAGFLAVRLNSLFLALIGLAGGYLTPVLVNTGEKNLPGLFAYLLLLGAGVLVVTSRRNWRLLTLFSMAATWGLYFVALDRFYDKTLPADFAVALGFLLAYFVLFSAVAFIYGLRRGERLSMVEVFEMLINAGVTGVAGINLVTGAHSREWAALLTAGLSLFYQVHIWLFLKRRVQDRALLVTLTMLAAVFLAVTLPLLIDGRWLTLAWAVQALAMLWAADKLGSRFLRQLAFLVYLVVFGRLVLVDLPALNQGPGTLDFTAWLKQFATHLVSFGGPLLALAGGWKLLRNQQDKSGDAAVPVTAENDVAGGAPEPGVGGLLLGICLGGAFLLMQVELWHCCGIFFLPLRLPALSLGFVLAAGLALAWHLRTGRPWALSLGVMLAAALVLKLLCVDLMSWNPIFDTFGYHGAFDGIAVAMRALDFGAACLFLMWGAFALRRSAGQNENGEPLLAGRLAGLAALVLLFIWLTLEVSEVLGQFLPGLRAGGVSILWALFAISLLFAGIRASQRNLRVTGLVLFAVVFAKVFLSDLDRLDAIYRILALFVVALLLGGGSFLYLRQSHKFTVKETAP